MAARHGWPQAPPPRSPGAGAPHPSRPPVWFRLVLALLLAACLLGAWQRPPMRAAGLGARQGQPSSWTPATRLASGVLIGTAIVWVLFFWSE